MRLYYPYVDIAAKDVLAALLYFGKTEHFRFQSGCVLQVVKHLKENWFIVYSVFAFTVRSLFL